MQKLSHGGDVADLVANLFRVGGASSLWRSTKQPQIHPLTTAASDYSNCHMKISESQYQDQDSSPTLSSGQSCHDAARSSFPLQDASFKQLCNKGGGFFETYNEGGEDPMSPPLPFENADYYSHQAQTEHPQPPLACISHPYFGKKTTEYEPNAAGFSQMVGTTPARVMLPLDIMEGTPIYVNAKQYHAILRRRQNRAKLLAQNKVAKSRKPYLHESRHLHALRRARGTGGRFLNTKNHKQSKTHDKNLQKINRDATASEAKIWHSEKNYSWGSSSISNSEVSCIFTHNDNFEPPDLGGSIPGLIADATVPIAAPHDNRLLLTMNRRARISTAM